MIQKTTRVRPELRATAWSLLALLAVVIAGVAACLIAPLVAPSAGRSSSPQAGAAGAGALVDFALEILPQVGWVILPLVILWLLLRRLRWLALFVVVVGIGTVALTLSLAPLARAGASLVPWVGVGSTPTPDALVLVATVTLGVLLLTRPAASAARGGWAIAALALADAAVVTAAAFAAQRLAPALIGWLVAVAWLAAAALIFRRWQSALPGRDVRLLAAPSREQRSLLRFAPAHDAPFAAGARSRLSLAVTAVLLCAGLIGAGLLITRHVDPVQRVDAAVAEWFVTIRTPELTGISHVVDPLGNTPGIIMVLLTAVTLASALTRRRAPVLFLISATAGETAIFLVSQAVVGRARPPVEHLADLPDTYSFPSGHVAASAVTYGAIALLLFAWAGSRVGSAAVALAALIVLGVALTRLYVGMHYVSDILSSLLFAAIWLALCWRAYRPERGAPQRP